MKNGRNARVPIDRFGLLINQAPSSNLTAANWISDFVTLGFAPQSFEWGTFAVKASKAHLISNDGSFSTPAYAIKPGSSLGGFEITSSRPPGAVQFFAEGFSQPPESTPTATNDEPTPLCPGWDFNNPQLETQITGVTVGPLDPGTISLKLRAREETGLRISPPLDPRRPKGRIAVLVLSTPSFDASQIKTSSVIFGPGYASPISSKLVRSGRGDNIGVDERLEWERWTDTLNPHHQKKIIREKSGNLTTIFFWYSTLHPWMCNASWIRPSFCEEVPI